MTVFTLLYGVLAVIATKVAFAHIKAGQPEELDEPSDQSLPVFTY